MNLPRAGQAHEGDTDVPDGHGHAPVPKCIVLVGFMAAGKSVVGRILADRLGWRFVDFDDAIRERTGRSAGAIIREDGEAALRALEAELTLELGSAERVVLAPGGGWATQPTLVASLGVDAVRVWLRVSPEEAVRRAEADGTDRPLMGPPERRIERMARLLHGRMADYGVAELTVDAEDNGPEAVADEILRRLKLATGG